MTPGGRDDWTGTLLALVSATLFGTLAIFVKLAYAEHIDFRQLLAYRFLGATAGLAILAAVARQPPWQVPRRSLLILALMGLTGYSLQSFTFIYSLRQLPASLVSLVLYTYPALVALGAWLIFRRPLTLVHVAGLVATFAGVALVIGGVQFAAGPALFWAALSPLVYTGYILAGERALRDAPPLPAALVVTGCAAATFTAVALASGQLRPPPTPAAGLTLLGIAALPTLLAITLFLAALPRIGAARTALLSTWEPVVTVGLAVALLGDRLAPLQVLGGALVLAAVAALQVPAITRAARRR